MVRKEFPSIAESETLVHTAFPELTCEHRSVDAQTSDEFIIRIYDKNLVSGDVDLGVLKVLVGEALAQSAASISSVNATQTSPFSHGSDARGRSSQRQWLQECAGSGPSRSSRPGATPASWNDRTAANVAMQRSMTRSYAVTPQGTISLVIVPGCFVDLAGSAPRRHFQRFQTHKFSEQVGNIGKIPFQNKVGHSVGKAIKSGAEKAKPLQAALNLLEPVHSAFQEHSTWKIEMREVDNVFGNKRHGWNRSYPAAQRIFEGKGSIVPRRVVQMQHAYLYGGASGIKPLVHMRKDFLEITGYALDARDFLRLMEFGVRRGKSRMFTYVLMPERLYLAETGAKFFRDMMSKHAMHCSAAPEVVYAGELHFRRSPHGSSEAEIRLILDNNSGTYAPGKEDLPLVEEVFRRNFQGLHVTALDYKDPRLIEYRNELLLRQGPGEGDETRMKLNS